MIEQRRLLPLMSEPESVSMIQRGGSVLKTVGNIGITSDNMGIMEKKMETTIIQWGYIGDNGKENGIYHYTVLISVKPYNGSFHFLFHYPHIILYYLISVGVLGSVGFRGAGIRGRRAFHIFKRSFLKQGALIPKPPKSLNPKPQTLCNPF